MHWCLSGKQECIGHILMLVWNPIKWGRSRRPHKTRCPLPQSTGSTGLNTKHKTQNTKPAAHSLDPQRLRIFIFSTGSNSKLTEFELSREKLFSKSDIPKGKQCIFKLGIKKDEIDLCELTIWLLFVNSYEIHEKLSSAGTLEIEVIRFFFHI